MDLQLFVRKRFQTVRKIETDLAASVCARGVFVRVELNLIIGPVAEINIYRRNLSISTLLITEFLYTNTWKQLCSKIRVQPLKCLEVKFMVGFAFVLHYYYFLM